MDAIRTIILEVEKLKANKDFDKAIELLENNLSKLEDYRLYEEISDIYLHLKFTSKAAKAINRALELNAKSATGHYLKGFISLSRGNIEIGLKHLLESNKLNGCNPEVLRNIGWAYAMNGESERGIMILKRALVILPNDPLIMEDLAMALISAGEVGEGNEIMKRIEKK